MNKASPVSYNKNDILLILEVYKSLRRHHLEDKLFIYHKEKLFPISELGELIVESLK